MYSHVTLGSNDFARARAFYEPVMKLLDHPVLMQSAQALGYGFPNGETLFILRPFDGKAASVGDGVHAAFRVDDRATVDAFHEMARANGGTDEGTPGLRTYYHPNCYGAYVRDPDGNKLQAVCHRATV